MIKISVNELKDILSCDIYNYKNFLINGVERDSRVINEENLFIPIKGENFDAHDFIDSVKEKGVKVSLWNKSKQPYPSDIVLLLVDDTFEALKKIAKFYVKKIGAKIIAVTGSNGKTSIKDMCAAVIGQKYKVTKTFKNYNNELGICLSICRANIDDEFLVLEMGMDNIGDIDKLVKIVDIDVAIISNIGSAHLLYLKSRENIAKAKLEILNGLKVDGVFIRPADEKLLEIECNNEVKTFGIEKGDIYAKNIEITLDGIKFDTNIIDDIRINSFGIVQVLNALPVIMVSKFFNIDNEIIKKGLSSVEFTERRNKIVKYKDNYVYDDTYKSNPEGLMKCFESMSYFNMNKVAVLSDMLELGEREVDYHKEVAEYAVKFGINKLFLYGELSKHTYTECIYKGIDVEYFENKFDIVEKLKGIRESIILFKASNAQKINEVMEEYLNEK